MSVANLLDYGSAPVLGFFTVRYHLITRNTAGARIGREALFPTRFSDDLTGLTQVERAQSPIGRQGGKGASWCGTHAVDQRESRIFDDRACLFEGEGSGASAGNDTRVDL